MLTKIYYWFHRLTSSPQERGEYSSGYWPARIRKETLKLCQGIEGRVLDVGCGEGLFIIPLASQNSSSEVWGVDNDTMQLKKSEERCKDMHLKNINLSLQDATGLSFQNEFFDAVICINVFINMNSLDLVKRTLTAMRRVCKKSGRIIFELRNSLNPIVLLKYNLAPYYDETLKKVPPSAYSQKQIESIIKDLNLKVKRKIFIGMPMFRTFAPIILIEAERND